MERNYFFFRGYFTISCWLILTIGTLKAQTLSTESKSVDTISYSTDPEFNINNEAKVFVSKGTEISNIHLITNAEVISLPDKNKVAGISNIDSKRNKTCKHLAVVKRKAVRYRLPVLRDEKIFDVSGSGSGVFLAYEGACKCLTLRQNHQNKELIQIAHVGINTKYIFSKSDAGYIYLEVFSNKLCTEFPSTRPPPFVI